MTIIQSIEYFKKLVNLNDLNTYLRLYEPKKNHGSVQRTIWNSVAYSFFKSHAQIL